MANAPQLPDYLRDRPFQPVSDRLGESLGAGAPPVLSIRGGRFTLVDAAGSEQPVTTAENGMPYVDAVIIDSLERYSKIYYDHPYDPTNPGPPTCFSDNGIAPSIHASNPQSPTCASCKWGAWGSATSKVDPSRGTKACADNQKLALMVPGTPGTYLLRVPPNSLRNCREYNARFKGSGTDIADVVTRISFEKDVLGTLVFRGVSYIDKDLAQKRNEALSHKATDTLVGRTDQPIQGAIAAPQKEPEQPPALPEETRFQATLPPLTSSAPPPGNGRRRGRPKASETPTQAVQAPFPTQSNPVPPSAAGGAPFGIGQGSLPDAGLNAKLDDFFGPVK